MRSNRRQAPATRRADGARSQSPSTRECAYLVAGQLDHTDPRTVNGRPVAGRPGKSPRCVVRIVHFAHCVRVGPCGEGQRERRCGNAVQAATTNCRHRVRKRHPLEVNRAAKRERTTAQFPAQPHILSAEVTESLAILRHGAVRWSDWDFAISGRIGAGCGPKNRRLSPTALCASADFT